MKAEQRKELETNALADRMGHLVQRVKTQPRRSAFYWVLGAVTLTVVLFVGFRWWQMSKEEHSRRWMEIESGSGPALSDLLREPETTQGKAARFQQAWLLFWREGIQRLGVEKLSALAKLEQAQSEYDKLAKDCEDDPIWEPEAMYALAVVEETRSVISDSDDHLEKAKERYEKLAKKYDKSARGELAAQWVERYADTRQRNELRSFYADMRQSLQIPDLLAPRKGPLDLGKGGKTDLKPPR
jgi:hypothetical protein